MSMNACSNQVSEKPVAFARNNDVDKSQPMEPFPEFLRDIGRVHSQWKLRDINPFTQKCRFELCQHEEESIGFGRMITTLFGTKEQRQCDVLDGAHHTEYVLTSDDFMLAPTLPTQCPAEKLTASIHDPVVNG